MAKNTGASKFRRVDVDQYNEDNYQVRGMKGRSIITYLVDSQFYTFICIILSLYDRCYGRYFLGGRWWRSGEWRRWRRIGRRPSQFPSLLRQKRGGSATASQSSTDCHEGPSRQRQSLCLSRQSYDVFQRWVSWEGPSWHSKSLFVTLICECFIHIILFSLLALNFVLYIHSKKTILSHFLYIFRREKYWWSDQYSRQRIGRRLDEVHLPLVRSSSRKKLCPGTHLAWQSLQGWRSWCNFENHDRQETCLKNAGELPIFATFHQELFFIHFEIFLSVFGSYWGTSWGRFANSSWRV